MALVFQSSSCLERWCPFKLSTEKVAILGFTFSNWNILEDNMMDMSSSYLRMGSMQKYDSWLLLFEGFSPIILVRRIYKIIVQVLFPIFAMSYVIRSSRLNICWTFRLVVLSWRNLGDSVVLLSFSMHRRAEEDYVYPNAIHPQSVITHVLSWETSYGSWECRLPKFSFCHEFSIGKGPLCNWR